MAYWPANRSAWIVGLNALLIPAISTVVPFPAVTAQCGFPKERRRVHSDEPGLTTPETFVMFNTMGQNKVNFSSP